MSRANIVDVVAVAFVVILATSGIACAFELPLGAYVHMKGEWNVEVASPCMPSFMNGAMEVANSSSPITFGAATPGEEASVVLSRPGADATTLSLGGLERFLSTGAGKGKLIYKVCRTQTNHLSTEKRPVFGLGMSTTQLTEMTGVLVAKGTSGDPCANPSKAVGEVVIRTVGMPMDVKISDADVKEKEAIQYAEVTIDTRGLPESCAAAARAADAEGAEKKKSRKRRGLRNTVGTSDASSEDAEAAVANGFTVIRLSKKNPPAKSLFQKFYPSLIFMGLFVLYRIVYGYFSYKSSQ